MSAVAAVKAAIGARRRPCAQRHGWPALRRRCSAVQHSALWGRAWLIASVKAVAIVVVDVASGYSQEAIQAGKL